MFKPVRIHPLLLIVGVAALFLLILCVAWANWVSIRPAPAPAVYAPTYHSSDYHAAPAVVVVRSAAKRESVRLTVTTTQAKKRVANVPPRVYPRQPSRATVTTKRTVSVTTTRRR